MLLVMDGCCIKSWRSRTDGSGSFRLDGIGEALGGDLEISAAGYESLEVRVVENRTAKADPWVIAVRRGASLSGCIRDARGQVVRYAFVAADADLRKVATGSMRLLPAGGSAYANGDGRYHIGGLSPGYALTVEVYTMNSRGDLKLAALHRASALKSGEERVLNFRLQPEHAVGGRVVDQNGSPVPGVRVLIGVVTYARRTPRLRQYDELIGSATTDAAGAFTIKGVPTGEWVLDFDGKSLPKDAGGDPVALRVPGDRDLTWELKLYRGVTIRGRVVCPPGVRPSEVEVTAVRDLGGRAQTYTIRYYQGFVPELIRADCRADGSFVLWGLMPGDYWVSAYSSKGLCSTMIRVTAGAQGIVMQPERDGILRGRVVDRGSSIPRLSYLVTLMPRNRKKGFPRIVQACEPFECEVDRGLYDIFASTWDGFVGFRSGVSVAKTHPAEEVTVVLDRGGVLEVSVDGSRGWYRCAIRPKAFHREIPLLASLVRAGGLAASTSVPPGAVEVILYDAMQEAGPTEVARKAITVETGRTQRVVFRLSK